MKRVLWALAVIFCPITVSYAGLDDGLIAYYPFDGNVNDESGNGNDGVVYGATFSPDRINVANHALHFDGNDYVSVPNSIELQSLTNNFSISFWVKIEQHSSQGFIPILCKSDSTDLYSRQFGFVLTAGGIVYFNDGAVVPGIQMPTPPVYGQWAFYAMTLSEGTIHLYRDGIHMGSTPLVASFAANNLPMEIGRDTPGIAEYYVGQLDDVRIYSRALSAAEVQQLFIAEGGLNAGLVAYYPFNGNANDESGNGNSGAVYGATLTAGVDSEANSAYKFDGLAYIQVDDSPELNFGTRDFSVSAWILADAQETWHQHIITKLHEDDMGGWALFLHANSASIGWVAESLDMLGTVIDFDKWVHIVVTRSGDTHRIYKNGVYVDEADIPDADYNLSDALNFGGGNHAGGSFSGKIDDVRIYNRALSATEVTQLYRTEGTNLPVKIIIDTDMASDCDDLGTLACAYALEETNEVEILGIVCNVSEPYAPFCLDAINTYYGRPDIPIGYCNRFNDIIPEYIDPCCNLPYYNRFAGPIAFRYPNNISARDIPDAVDVYSALLNSNDNVTIVSIGSMHNLEKLLKTPNGQELIRDRVRRLVVMGGLYPTPDVAPSIPEMLSTGDLRAYYFDFNFSLDSQSAIYVIQNWPGEILFTGLGGSIWTGDQLWETNKTRIPNTGLFNDSKVSADNPIRYGYDIGTELWRFDDHIFGRRNSRERPCWDDIAILYAARGCQSNFTEVRGTCIPTRTEFTILRQLLYSPVFKTDIAGWLMAPIGVGNRFIPDPNGPHSYLVQNVEDRVIANQIDELITSPVRSVITFKPIARNVRVGGTDVNLNNYCTINAGQTIEYTSSNPEVACIVNGYKLHAVAPGTTVITASNATSPYFRPATPVTQTVQVYEPIDNPFELDIPSLLIDLFGPLATGRNPSSAAFMKSSAAYTTTVSTITISGSATDDVEVATVEWVNDRGGSGICVGTETWTATNILLCPGENVITFTVSDTAGKTSSQSVTIAYLPLDQQAPYIAITFPTSEASYTTRVSTLDIRGTVQDNEGLSSVIWSNSVGGSASCEVSNTTWKADIPLLEGTNIVTVIALDTSGNTGSVTTTFAYIDEPDAPELTVIGGLGSGRYAAGEQVTVYADAPLYGQVFDQWTGDVGNLASTSSPITTVTMPDADIAVTATYKAGIYRLSVDGGSGEGEYGAGADAAITAHLMPGLIFDKWLGDTNCIASVTSPTTTVTMSDYPLTVMATYWPFSIDAFESISGEDQNYRLQWSGAPNRNYRICLTTNLVGGNSQCVISNLNATAIQGEYTLTNPVDDKAFFSIELE